MNEHPQTPTSIARGLRDPVTRGSFYCVFSALAYTAYSVCLRDVADRYDPAWINCVQASVGTAIFAGYLLWQAIRCRPTLPSRSESLMLLALGGITQLGGVLLVWAIGIVGVGVSMTLQMGLMLAGSAVLGRIALGERIAGRQIAAIALITAAITLMSIGAQATGDSAAVGSIVTRESLFGNTLRVPLGVTAAIVSGIAFALLTVGIRKTVTGATSPEAVVFLINAAGVIALGPWCLHRLGTTELLKTDPRCLAVMLVAGFFNVLGFLLLTKSLQIVAVVRANVINNALTMVLTVVAGLVLFAEPINACLLAGIAFSILGVILISLVQPQEECQIA
jgi:drug/metabolite transporter, DME family